MIKNPRLTPKHEDFATLLQKVKSNPYRKFISRQMRTIEKNQNHDEKQLERESEEEAMRIATNFCIKVQAWDEADAISSSALELDKKVDAESKTLETSILDKESHSKFKHLSDPEWVVKLFQVDFSPHWMQGFTRKLEEEIVEAPLCDLLGKYQK